MVSGKQQEETGSRSVNITSATCLWVATTYHTGMQERLRGELCPCWSLLGCCAGQQIVLASVATHSKRSAYKNQNPRMIVSIFFSISGKGLGGGPARLRRPCLASRAFGTCSLAARMAEVAAGLQDFSYERHERQNQEGKHVGGPGLFHARLLFGRLRARLYTTPILPQYNPYNPCSFRFLFRYPNITI